MDVAKPSASLFDLHDIISRLSEADREKVESDSFRALFMPTFSRLMDADGLVSEEDAVEAVLACVPQERQPVLGLTAETALAFLGNFGVTGVITSDTYIYIAQWAEAERILELCDGPVVPLVLPAGSGRAGVDTVEQCIERIENSAAIVGPVIRAGDMAWVQKIANKCLPDVNPEGFRTCQHVAASVVPTLLRFAVNTPQQRAGLLEAIARVAAGSVEAGARLAQSSSFREVLEIALRPGKQGATPPASALDVHAALQACASAAYQDFAATSLEPFVPTIASFALADHAGSFATVQAAALSVLAQLSTHDALKPAVAKSLPMGVLVRLLSGHRAMERRDDRFDFQLLCLQLLAETTADGCRILDLLEDLVAQGVPANLIEALDAAVAGAEYPLGSRCFRRPGPLVQCIAAVAREGKASKLRGAIGALSQLLEDRDIRPEALRALLAVGASRRCAEHMMGDAAFVNRLEEVAADARNYGDDDVFALCEEVLQALRAKVAENPPVYEVDEWKELFGDRTALMLSGSTLPSDERLVCCDADEALERVLEAGVIVWDGEAPAVQRPTRREEDVPNLSNSFTQLIDRALLEAENRGLPLVAAGFCGTDVATAQAAWANVAQAFPGRLVLFGSARCPAAPLPMEDLVRAVSGLTDGTARTHRSSHALPDSSTAAPSIASEDMRSVASQEAAFASACLCAVAPKTVVSVGLTGPAKEDFARMAGGEVSGPEEWIVFPAFSQHAKRADASMAEWGGMQLTERCVLDAASREVSATSGNWKLTLAADGEWVVQ